MNAEVKKILKYTLSFAAAAVLVWLAFRKVDWKVFLDGLIQTRWGWVVPYFAASLGALYFRMLRWKALIKPMDPDVRSLTVWDADNVGNLASVALPGVGEIVRCGYIAKGKAGFGSLFGTVLMERIWDILAIIFLFVVSLTLGWNRFGRYFKEQIVDPISSGLDSSIWWIAAILLAAVAVFFVLTFSLKDRHRFFGKIYGTLKGFGEGLKTFGKLENKWLFFGYTAGVWLMYILMTFSMVLAVPEISGLDFLDALFISAVGNVASVIPVPGGIGAYHYLVALLVSSFYATSWETGILFATLNHELHAVLILVLGVISYFSFKLISNSNKI